MITTDYQAVRPSAGGAMLFQFGPTRIVLPDCRLDDVTANYSKGRKLDFRVLDRRWRWQEQFGGGFIWGKYNERQPDQKTIKPETKKTPQELARLLLDEMGENGYDVSKLPNDSSPAVDWVAANPAAELARLCEDLGCRVVLHLDNRVRIQRKGQGARLPTAGALTHSYGLDPTERPDTVVAVGEPTQFQSRLKLEPRIQDEDGIFKHPDDVSWKPSGGWENTEPQVMTQVQDPEQRKLARRDVFFLYAVTGEQFDGKDVFPGPDGFKIEKVSEILPLGAEKVEYDRQPDGSIVRRPADVYGAFYDNVYGWLDITNSDHVSTYKDTKKTERYPGSFSIDSNLGHVRFSKPVYRHTDQNGRETTKYYFAELMLEVSYTITLRKYNQKIRHVRSRTMPGQPLGTGSKPIPIDGLIRTMVAKYRIEDDRVAFQEIDDSEEDFNREADHYLRQQELLYQSTETNDVAYAGIVRLDLDGLRQQVTWTVGGGPATTRASTNTEHNYNVVPYERNLERTLNRRELRKIKIVEPPI